MSLETHKSRGLGYEGAERIEEAKVWLGQNAKILLGVIGAIVLAGAFFIFNNRSRSVQEGAAAGKLAEANVYYWQGDYARSLELSKQIYGQYATTASGLEAHRLAGDASFWNGDFKTAVAEYKKYLERMKKGVFADAARRSMAYALESDGQHLEAAKIYEDLVGKFDRTSSAEFLVAAARCYRTLGKPADAIARLKRVDAEFGETPYANEARVEVGELTAGGGR